MNRKRFRKVIRQLILKEAGGQSGGSKEIMNSTIDDAYKIASNLGLDLLQIDNFDRNYKLAKKLAGYGKTQRKDMPVITDTQVKTFQKRLKKGYIDIFEPLADETNPSNPFPQGLSGEDAKEFLENGLNDGEVSDDKVNVSVKLKSVGKLKPIQRQIYLDKALESLAFSDLDGFKKFISSTYFITSDDGFIIDGHHRFLSSVLYNPKMKVKCLTIDLPILDLLPLSLAYGDAIGNSRNM